MATIISQPDTLSLCSNIRKFEIASSGEVRFKLSVDGTILVDESYSPNASGKICIDVKEVVSNQLSFTLPTTEIFRQNAIVKPFVAQIDSSYVSFTAIRSGVENLSDTPVSFLMANFLTWQPQSKMVSYYQSEWLTYYAPVAGVVKIRFYLKDNTSSIITIHNIEAGSCFTYNMQFSFIMSLLAGEKQGYYDVWVENGSGQRLTYIQRYIYREAEPKDEYFLSENSLGGLDTEVMTGESTFAPELEYTDGSYNEECVQLDGTYTRLYSKNTGWKSNTEAAWLWDFFASKYRYKVQDGSIVKITLKESSIQDSSSEDMKSFVFSYRMASDRGLLNLQRSDNLPANLEITTPEGLFFLTPRLNELTSATPDDSLLFPVQSPFSQVWRKFSWGAIWSFIYNKILESAIGIMAHVHDNFAVISKLAAPAGKLQYDGQDVGIVTTTGVNLGDTNITAYRGDRGKIAYDHSQKTDIHFTDAPETGKPYARSNKEWVQIQQPGGTAVRLSTNKQVFEYDGNGAFVDTLSFAWIYTTLFNMSAENVYYEWLKNGISFQNTVSSVLCYSPPATYRSPDIIEVRVRIGSVDSNIIATDSITMYGIKPGANGKDAYTVVLSNPFHSFPADKDGVITDYSGSGTDIRVWKGITPLPYGAGANTFSVTAAGTNVSVGSSSIVSVYTRRYSNSSNMVAVTARIDFTIKARDKDNNEVEFIQTLTYTITKEGQPGNNGTPGPAGPSLVFQGDYNTSAIYTGSSNRIDVVKYTNGKYYSALRTAGTFSGKAPIDSLYWQIADGQFKFVATELLFAESTYVKNLIAEQVKTAISGKRIEINAGDEQKIVILDNNENVKVIIKPEPVESIASIEQGTSVSFAAPTADNSIQSIDWIHPDFGAWEGSQNSSSFSTPATEGIYEIEVSNVLIEANVYPGQYASGAATIEVVLEKYSGGVWEFVGFIGSCSESQGSKNIYATIRGLSQGTYRLTANHHHMSWTSYQGNEQFADSSITSSRWICTNGSTFSITMRKIIAQTQMGTDGIASVWAANRYLHFSQNGLFVKMGNKSLEITENNFKINGIEH